MNYQILLQLYLCFTFCGGGIIMVKINLNDPNIMGSQEAAKIWGKNLTYVRTSLKQSPEKWPKGSYRLFGHQLIVTTEGMEAATGEKDPRRNKESF